MSLVYARSVLLLKRAPISTASHLRHPLFGLSARTSYRPLVTTASPLVVLPSVPTRSARTKSRPRFLNHPEPRSFDDYDIGEDIVKEQMEQDERIEQRLNRPIKTSPPKKSRKDDDEEEGTTKPTQKIRSSFVDVGGRTAVSSNKVETIEALRKVVKQTKAAGTHPSLSQAQTKTKGPARKGKTDAEVEQQAEKPAKKGRGRKATPVVEEESTQEPFFDEAADAERSAIDGDPIQAKFHAFAEHGERDDVILPREIVAHIRKVLEEHHYSRNQSDEYMEHNFHLNYLANRMTNDILILTRLLKELAKRAPKFEPTSILDISAKTGAGLWAVDSVYGDINPQIVAVESTAQMLALGKRVTHNHKLRPTVHWEDAMNPVKIGVHNLVISNDHIAMRPPAVQRSLAEAMWNHTKDVLIMVEAGTKEGFAAIRNVREHILAKYGGSDPAQQPTIIAPCPHAEACPMTEKRQCIFRIRVPRVNIPKQSWAREIKVQPHVGNVFIDGYSYLIIQKGSRDRFLNESYNDLTAFIESASNPTELTDDQGRPTSAAAFLYQNTNSKNRMSFSDLYQRAINTSFQQAGGEPTQTPIFDAQPEAYAHLWSRMISPPLKQKRHIILDVCAADGLLHRTTVPKKFPVPKAYAYAKDARWGDQWPYPLKPTRREQMIAAGEFKAEWDQNGRSLRDEEEGAEDEDVDENPEIHSVEDIEEALRVMEHKMDPKQVKELKAAIVEVKAKAAVEDREDAEDEDEGDASEYIDAKSSDRTAAQEKEPEVAASLKKKKKKKSLRQQQADDIEKLEKLMLEEERLDGGISKHLRRLKMRTLDEMVHDEERITRQTVKDIEEDALAEEFEKAGGKYRARSARKYQLLDEFEEMQADPYFDETAGVPRMAGETHQEHLRRVRKEAADAEREFDDVKERAAEVREARKERKESMKKEKEERRRERELRSQFRFGTDDEVASRKKSKEDDNVPDDSEVQLEPELETMLEEVTMGLRTEEDAVAINVMYAQKLKNSGAKLSQEEEEFIDEMEDFAKLYHLDSSKLKVRPLKDETVEMPPAAEPKQTEELPSQKMGRRKSVREVRRRQHKISLSRIKQHEPIADVR